MPSPIVHSFLGYLVFRLFKKRLHWKGLQMIGPLPMLLALTVFFSLLPDIDSVLGVVMGDFGGIHNQWTHSLYTGLGFAVVFGMLISRVQQTRFIKWFFLVLLCYQLHILADFLTFGRGVMLFWPLTEERYTSPILLFYGVHWSQGLFSLKHLWTLVSELAFVAGIYFLINKLGKKRVVEDAYGRSKKGKIILNE
jgi:inner membrane protein